MFKNELSALCLGLHSGKARLRGGSSAFFPRCHRLFRGMLEGSSTSPQEMDILYNNLILYGVLAVVSWGPSFQLGIPTTLCDRSWGSLDGCERKIEHLMVKITILHYPWGTARFSYSVIILSQIARHFCTTDDQKRSICPKSIAALAHAKSPLTTRRAKGFPVDVEIPRVPNRSLPQWRARSPSRFFRSRTGNVLKCGRGEGYRGVPSGRLFGERSF